MSKAQRSVEKPPEEKRQHKYAIAENFAKNEKLVKSENKNRVLTPPVDSEPFTPSPSSSGEPRTRAFSKMSQMGLWSKNFR